ncbi:MAG: hypothetical protein IT347_03730 [Candidatus Eisenbacteria bacterium]|nr:hypothetical protein [Candidatus Eisenbacteria bacterium]
MRLRRMRFAAPLALAALVALPGCTAVQELAALRLVSFGLSNVSDVKLVGIPIGPGADYSKLGLADVARLAAALVARQAPLELVAHVSATNPPENKVSARLVGLGWKLFVEDRQAIAGNLDTPVEIPSGRTVDVPVAVRFDLAQLGSGGARDLFDLAVAIAGQGAITKDLRLELVPTIETRLGPLTYPSPIVIRRTGADR